ncbi:hypothetical protein ACOSQ4_001106 [Xanthoceras sorbifolium]
MNCEKAISFGSGGSTTTLLPKSVGILLVDGDSTCLTILSKMLRRFGYKVMTAKRASDALCIIREREDEVGVVLSEAYLPDMNKYELLETVGKMSKLPVVIMSADGNENDMLGGLFKGAAFYLVKPITMNNIKYLWQFAFMKKTDTPVAADRVSGNSPDEDMEDQMFPYEVKQSHRNAKRKEPKEMDKIEEEYDDDSSVIKKPKLVWTNELHNRFLQAIRVLGIDGAHPKKILQYMNVPGLKKENISSHLQKYRLSLKREQDTNEKTMNRDYSKSHLAVYDLPSTLNLQGGLFQFPERQSMARSCQPELGSYDRKNLNSSSMFMPMLDSAYFLKPPGPSCNDTSNFKYGQLTPDSTGFTYPGSYCEGIGTNDTSNFKYGQLTPHSTGFTYPGSFHEEIGITCRERLADLHRIVDSNGEEFHKGKRAFASCGESGFVGALQWPTSLTQQEEEDFLKGKMAFSSCGDSGFVGALQWPTSLTQQQDEDFFNGKMALSSCCGDSGFGTAVQGPKLLGQQEDERKQQEEEEQEQELQQQQLVLPHQSLADLDDHDIFGSERVEIDGLFDMEKLSSQLFLDDDFNDLW